MQIHIIIHASFELPGIIDVWAKEKNLTVSYTHTYQNETLPQPDTVDFLIIMGGPQSPRQLNQYPYLRDEIIFTQQIIKQHKPVLGICLGAQIIGESLGAATEQSPHKEIGVFPIHLTTEGKQDPIFSTFSSILDVMHWHNDMPGLPHNAQLLAYSEGCPRQAIRYNDRVYGLQFHIEMTPELVKGMLAHCANDLTAGKYVQTREILNSIDFTAMNKHMRNLLDYLLGFIV